MRKVLKLNSWCRGAGRLPLRTQGNIAADLRAGAGKELRAAAAGLLPRRPSHHLQTGMEGSSMIYVYICAACFVGGIVWAFVEALRG
jgi:hypothetical protein